MRQSIFANTHKNGVYDKGACVPTLLDEVSANLQMSVEQSDVVDIISTDRLTGAVVLTITDHLDWTNSTAHQLILQTKLNRYLAFVESGEILQSYPGAKEGAIVLRIVFKFPPDTDGRAFLARARAIVASAGFSLRDEVSTGAPFN